jgi:hypothetical protein
MFLSKKLLFEDPLNLSNLALNFAANFLGSATIAQIGIPNHFSGFLFRLAFGFLNGSCNPVFGARVHTYYSRLTALARLFLTIGPASPESVIAVL